MGAFIRRERQDWGEQPIRLDAPALGSIRPDCCRPGMLSNFNSLASVASGEWPVFGERIGALTASTRPEAAVGHCR